LRPPPRSLASERSLLIVRAAISSARSLLMPRRRPDALMCSYCRPRLLPGLTPRGGICLLPRATARKRSFEAISKPSERCGEGTCEGARCGIRVRHVQ
jgi:hypothetical protein